MASLSFKENALLAYQHKEPEYLPIPSDFDISAPRGMNFINESISVEGTANDWFGQSWTWESKVGAPNPTPGVRLIEDITKWRDVIKCPDLSKLDWEGRAAQDTANWDRDRKLSRIILGYGPWERLFTTMEFSECLMALVAEPEACYEFFGEIAEHKIRLHDYIIKYYKPDILVMHDDYGHGNGMFMSPDTWRELIKPHLKRIIEAVTSKGVIYEHHSCGYFAPIAGEIADLGASATNGMQIVNKPKELKKEIGHKLCFVGGFDTTMMDYPETTEEQIRSSIRQTIDDLAPGGSWIANCGLRMPERNKIAIDEIITYGSTKYTSPRPDLHAERGSGLEGIFSIKVEK